MSEISPKRVILFGASGTIGGAVARALVGDGHRVTCVVRSPHEFERASVAIADVTDRASVAALFADTPYDAVVSCLASRTGIPDDAWAIDYKANASVLGAAKAAGVPQFTLLSAICVQNPRLAFQHAKLAFEEELRASGLTWSIVRPTAFFKSLSGQIERVKAGKPFLLFGNGELTRCKPISDDDLARYIVATLADKSKHNRILPIGGPGPAISPREQGEKLFELLGEEPRWRHIPVAMMDAVVAGLALAGKLSRRAAAKAEYARIGRYYATESMLVLDEATGEYDADATPETGQETLWDHYVRRAGGD